MIRIFSGKYKNRKIKVPQGLRPTQNIVKEAVFNIILHNQFKKNMLFLDLCAGAGSIGIEALSFGFKTLFVEKYKSYTENIKSNLIKLNVENKILSQSKTANITYEDLEIPIIIIGDILKVIKLLNIKFDIIYLDPPYNSTYGIKLLKMNALIKIMNKNGLLFFETDNKNADIFKKPSNSCLNLSEIKFYGNTSLLIFNADNTKKTEE